MSRLKSEVTVKMKKKNVPSGGGVDDGHLFSLGPGDDGDKDARKMHDGR